MHGRKSRALGLCLVLAAAPLTAQSAAFKAALPEHTLVFASLPNIRASLEEMKDQPLARIWREGEVQDFLADGLQMVEAHWEQGLAEGRKLHEAGKLPFDPADLTKLRIESLSMALTDLELGGTDEGAPGPRGEGGFYAGYFRDLDGNKLNAFCIG